jgi:hypothetical protein
VRDSPSGQIEINEAEAVVVRRILQMYADGVSPRNVAGTLNAEGVPSPGASWNRSTRRRDRKLLASAIHGDANRGTGILNNRRYIGVTLWGRSEWKRSAADSKKRRFRMLAKGSAHEMTDERLRIVPAELWGSASRRGRRSAAMRSVRWCAVDFADERKAQGGRASIYSRGCWLVIPARRPSGCAIAITMRRPTLIVPNIRGRFLSMVDRLDDVLMLEPERARNELRGLLGVGERIKLKPDESGRFLWAEYSLGLSALMPNADLMVAGARFLNYRCRLSLAGKGRDL